MNEIEKKYYEEFLAFINSNMKVEFLSDKSKVKVMVFLRSIISDEKRKSNAITFDIKLNCEHDDSYKNFYPPYPETTFVFDISAGTERDNISGYIPDFTITKEGCIDFCDYTESKYVIEIDGHEWHEKTKEQVSRDKQKERAYLINGYIPIRFSGSEVYHNPTLCVEETLKIIAEFEKEKLFAEICQNKRRVIKKNG